MRIDVGWLGLKQSSHQSRAIAGDHRYTRESIATAWHKLVHFVIAHMRQGFEKEMDRIGVPL